MTIDLARRPPVSTSFAPAHTVQCRSVLPAGLALASTAAMLLPFMLPLSMRETVRQELPRLLWLLPLPAATSPRTAAASTIGPTSPAPARRARPVAAPAPVDPQALPSPATPSMAPASVAGSVSFEGETQARPSAADAPASAPLRLDSRSILEAHRASKSDARRMAEAGGSYFGDSPASKQERLATAVAKTAKPPCIGPGGSLLSLIVIAYKISQDECR